MACALNADLRNGDVLQTGASWTGRQEGGVLGTT